MGIEDVLLSGDALMLPLDSRLLIFPIQWLKSLKKFFLDLQLVLLASPLKSCNIQQQKTTKSWFSGKENTIVLLACIYTDSSLLYVYTGYDFGSKVTAKGEELRILNRCFMIRTIDNS